jgi:hypothetical protein
MGNEAGPSKKPGRKGGLSESVGKKYPPPAVCCYVCPPEKRKVNDEAEVSLLGGYPTGYGFGDVQQTGYSSPFFVPNQGAFFPIVPDPQNTGDF